MGRTLQQATTEEEKVTKEEKPIPPHKEPVGCISLSLEVEAEVWAPMQNVREVPLLKEAVSQSDPREDLFLGKVASEY